MGTTRSAVARWEGTLLEGSGTTTLHSSGLGTFDVSWPARTEPPQGKTSPEELIAAAHAACYSMAFSHGLSQAGFPPNGVDVNADVTFDKTDEGWAITKIHLQVRGEVPGITAEGFAEQAQAAKTGCPVSRALAGVPEITLDAELV